MEENAPSQTPAKKNNTLMIVAVLVVVALAGAGLFMVTKPKPVVQETATDQTQESMQEEMSEATQEGSPSGSANAGSEVSPTTGVAGEDSSDMKVVTVVGNNFAFDVKTIRVKKGEKVKIIFENKEGFHDLVIDEFNVKTPQLTANKTAEVTFTPTKTGTFEYYCSVGTHRQMGMVGKLIVE